MADRADIVRKVQACLALAAADSGALGPERATARAMADKLMAANGLRESDIPKRQVQRASPPPPPAPVFEGVMFVVNIAGFGGFGGSGVFGSYGFENSTSTTTGF